MLNAVTAAPWEAERSGTGGQATADTARRRLVPGEPGRAGYRPLAVTGGEAHRVRDDLTRRDLRPGWRRGARPLLVLAQLSDTHVMDHQSPGRVELLDRFSDPDSPVREAVGIVATYRAQELFTHQVLEAMTQSVRELGRGPVTGAPIDFAVLTGDGTDNCQHNELRSLITLLDGGPVHPDSGDPGRYEGVSGPAVEDGRYWHPDSGCEDLPRMRFGFPSAPGVLDAVRQPFRAAGLGMPWYAVHGNHDNLLQGTVPAGGWLPRAVTGMAKVVTPPGNLEAASTISRLAECNIEALLGLADGKRIRVTPDPGRQPAAGAASVAEFFRTTGRPRGHGYSERNLRDGTAHYAFDHGVVRCIVLDTVNQHGGWEGSLDVVQLNWLIAELRACALRPVMLFSHHPLETLVNDRRPAGAPRRILAAEFLDVLLAHPCVIAWVNGHTHAHAVTAVRDDRAPGGFWQITTASHIDWPQQARVIELVAVPGGLAVGCTVIDSAAPARYPGGDRPVELAALARELALNDWQVRHLISADGGGGAGTAADRNVILPVEWPRAVITQ